MPRDLPPKPPLDDPALERSLDRYLTAGLVFMAVLIAGFGIYRLREPNLRADARSAQQVAYANAGRSIFATNCSSCHGKDAVGGSGPTLNAKEFLSSTTDDQIHALVAAGIPGTEMPSWSLDYNGTLTDEQVREVVAYLRSLEKTAPSVPGWRSGKG